MLTEHDGRLRSNPILADGYSLRVGQTRRPGEFWLCLRPWETEHDHGACVSLGRASLELLHEQIGALLDAPTLEVIAGSDLRPGDVIVDGSPEVRVLSIERSDVGGWLIHHELLDGSERGSWSLVGDMRVEVRLPRPKAAA